MRFRRKPGACEPSPVRECPSPVRECPGCRAQRIAAGKTIEEWYDDSLVRI